RPCIPRVMAPPIPAAPRVVTDPFIFPGSITRLSRAPVCRGAASNAIHEADGDVDHGPLSEEIEQYSHPSALRAGLLHDRDQARERTARDLHAVARLERGKRADDAALPRARDDEADRALRNGGRRRPEGDEAPHTRRPDDPVVLVEER